MKVLIVFEGAFVTILLQLNQEFEIDQFCRDDRPRRCFLRLVIVQAKVVEKV